MAPQHAPRSLATLPRVVRLPDPTQHARRQRDATIRLLDPTGARLLYVDSVALDGTVVLRDAAGAIIDEDVVVVSSRRVAPGDRVVRLALPGSGARDAAASYVALGPVNPQRLAPVMTSGPAMGSSPTNLICNGTDDYVRFSFTTGSAPAANAVLLTLAWNVPLLTSNYGLVVLARGPASAAIIGGGYWVSSPTTSSASLSVVAALPATSSIAFHLARIVDPS